MPARSQPRRLIEVARRVLAGGCAALALALTIFAASPGAHQWLHEETQPGGDDGCVVTLFASGVPLPLSVALVAPVPLVHVEIFSVASTEVLLASPRYLRHPERGPPAVQVG